MNRSNIQIGLTGDVMIGRLVNENLDYKDSHYLWGDVLPLLLKNDLNIMNLEAALTFSKKIVPKVFNFKADPQKVQVLIDANVDLVNIANNHILDFSEEGLLETLVTLDRVGILHVGAGKTIEEARKPAIIVRKEIKVGVIGYTDNESSWLAGPKKAGTNYIKIGDLKAVKEDLAHLRKNVDILIVTIHWGPNMLERPSQRFIEFAHFLIENGADIIHGHSAHIFQGVEKYKKGIILYDTGDFVDDYAVDPFLRNDRSFLFQLEVNKQRLLKLRLFPVLISNFQVNKAKNKDAEDTKERMKKLSSEFGTHFREEEGCLVLDFNGHLI